MYVVYKILNVIRLTEELNEKYDRFHFVPIFWMASEDHDLEEIQQMKLYGKDFTWEPGQTGAVGRMQSTGISAMLSELKNELNLNEDTLLFIDQLLKASESGNLSELSRNLLHQLFGDIGLLVIDPDQEDFKRSLRDVALKDLQYGGNEQYLESSQVLKAQGFEPQIHLRDSNLFLLGEKSRDRVDKLDNQLIVNGKVLGSLDNIKDFVDNWLVNLSPNVVLRPLYQEALLPNVIYVAGPSELGRATASAGDGACRRRRRDRYGNLGAAGQGVRVLCCRHPGPAWDRYRRTGGWVEGAGLRL
jgi:uncharacterized protein YllA (UPF0747 family)